MKIEREGGGQLKKESPEFKREISYDGSFLRYTYTFVGQNSRVLRVWVGGYYRGENIVVW